MLYIVATPIGDKSEISLRALEILKNAPVIICESTKETSTLLKHHGMIGKKYEVLNEHTKAEELPALLTLCKEQDVALVSDCGTPGFSDPGADLIRLCRQNQVEIKSVLGASSLMGILSLASMKIPEFVFRGFLPAENNERKREIEKLKKEHRAIILMDTPYRLKKLLSELKLVLPERKALLALNLSGEDEQVLEGQLKDISTRLSHEKAEFMLLIYPG